MASSALKKLVSHVSKPYEQIGLLIGEIKGNYIMVSEIFEGEGFADDSRSILSPNSMAKLANDLLSGKMSGQIVGWYHSHIGCGVFMSDVDIQTQLILQQFSRYIISLVIDAKTGDLSVFTYTQPYGIVSIPIDFVDLH